MKKYISVLQKTKIFFRLSEEETAKALECFGTKIQTYSKDEYVLRQGECTQDISILLYGRLYIQKEDYWGNRSILGQIAPGEMFGEAYAASKNGSILNDVVAVENSTVIRFNLKRILTQCEKQCNFHSAVIQNLFFSISEKNIALVQKIGHMSMRSTREKLISYLSEEAKKQNAPQFTIPFNRQQLADFLSVDRSAMSNELSKMRADGLIEFRKNSFKLLLKQGKEI